MRLIRWKRIGQSGQELVAAILFSFVIHGLLIAAFLMFSFVATSKVSVPLSYQVTLVSAPAVVEPAQPQEAQTPSLKPAETLVQKKTAPPARFAATRAKSTTAAKSAMPELGASKAAQKKIEERPEAATEKGAPGAPAGPASSAGVLVKEGVAVSAGQQSQLPGLLSYLPIVRDNIARNWNPPPGVREAKAKVMFRILRSGRVAEVKLQQPSENTYFDLAAQRAIFSVGSFPPLPEEYPREYLELSVDLVPKH